MKAMLLAVSLLFAFPALAADGEPPAKKFRQLPVTLRAALAMHRQSDSHLTELWMSA